MQPILSFKLFENLNLVKIIVAVASWIQGDLKLKMDEDILKAIWKFILSTQN